MDYTETLLILYGSQSGNSQDLAERIWRKAKLFNLKCHLRSFDGFDLKKLENTNAKLICVCSTTGQGDVPDNMTKFWRIIMRKSMPSDCLKNLKFAVIGLGDSSYEKYNFVSKKLYKRFIQLGGTPLLELCLCDDQQSDGIEGTYSRWIKNFWYTIDIDPEKETLKNEKISKYKIVHLEENSPVEESFEKIEEKAANNLKPFYASVLKNERLTLKEHFQDTRLIEFDCSNTNRVNYEAGDILLIRPSNLNDIVSKFLDMFQHLNLDLDQKIKTVPNYFDEIEIEDEISEEYIKNVRDLIEKYFDLNSVPRYSFFEIFAQIADDELEKEKLEEFLTPEGLEDLYNYCYRPRRKIIEIFHDFPKTTKLINSLNVLLDLVPAIKPRSFSIASNPYVHKDRIQILVAVVEYKTRLFESRKGTCSYWLSTLKPNPELKYPIWIKKGSFKIDYSKPLVCIGPGTGVAPFRSILNEKIFKHKCGLSHLYFGCRSKLKDFYFEKEWSEIQEIYPNYFCLHPAFSRDQDNKIYVQDVMLKNSNQLFELIYHLDAYILIAGNSKRMPEDVIATLENIMTLNLANNTENKENAEKLAKNFIDKLKTSQRIQLETWS